MKQGHFVKGSLEDRLKHDIDIPQIEFINATTRTTTTNIYQIARTPYHPARQACGTTRMTSVQPTFHMLSPGGNAISGHASKEYAVGDWPVFNKPETLEDIRFTFSIWHQPISKAGILAQRNDVESRARTTTRPVRATAPFAWLPLLPIEKPVEVGQVGDDYVVTTGFPLVSPATEEDRVPAIPNLVRRASVAVVDGEQETSAARKKQRLAVESQDLEEVEASVEHRDVAPIIETKRKEVLGVKIQKVRMRDVDVVEDFLVRTAVQGLHKRDADPLTHLQDQFLPEFGTGVPLRILLGTPGVFALAVQALPRRNPQERAQEDRPADALDPTNPILALVVYRKTRSDQESVTTHMQAIAVRPSSRRLGLGQQLVREALEDSRRDVQSVATPRIRLKAEGYDGNGSREFWQRCIAGFQVSSRRIGCRRGWTGEAQL